MFHNHIVLLRPRGAAPGWRSVDHCNMRHTSTDSEGWEVSFGMLTLCELKLYNFLINLVQERIMS
jgi:hypothetical protein